MARWCCMAVVFIQSDSICQKARPGGRVDSEIVGVSGTHAQTSFPGGGTTVTTVTCIHHRGPHHTVACPDPSGRQRWYRWNTPCNIRYQGQQSQASAPAADTTEEAQDRTDSASSTSDRSAFTCCHWGGQHCMAACPGLNVQQQKH